MRVPVVALVLFAATVGRASGQEPAEPRAPEPQVMLVPEPPVVPAALEVHARVRSAADERRHSAEAVHVLDTRDARRLTADLGEVLARTQGVGVQRSGGLGSDTRFSLNGLTDDQIRFFLDGVPLELAGYPFGIANVPVNNVERVEVFRGVVPIRFGADALGGAVNLVSEDKLVPRRAAASLQAGSFGTYRLNGSAQYLHVPSGWLTRGGVFFDRADNDYPMNIEVADATGRKVPARVYRFHDAYRASGGNIESGVVDRKWADRLLVRAFFTDYRKEIQNNPLMTYVYGAAQRSGTSSGATLRYEHRLGPVSLNALGGYTYDVLGFRDVSSCVYNWFGSCIDQRGQPGEIAGRAQDQLYWTQAVYARANADWRITAQHSLRASISPSYTTRTGDERRQANLEARDSLTAERDVYGLVSGVDHRLELFAGRLENVLFAKDYLQVLRSEESPTPGVFRRADRNTHRVGFGDALRLDITRALYAKASYEWATRLPRPDEIFGNGFPVLPNLGLKPEISHNVNLELDARSERGRAGVFHGNVNGFFREVDQLIVLVGSNLAATYQNVFRARSLGVETAADWISPGRYGVLSGNLTYVDFRNTSREGAFAKNEGDRIPNRPWFFANASARLQVHDLAAERDELAVVWSSRYVHAFLRGWEGLGDPDSKLTIDAQLLHALALVYVTRKDSTTLSFSGEVQNLTDQAAYDFYGVPRPGRAFYFKATASM